MRFINYSRGYVQIHKQNANHKDDLPLNIELFPKNYTMSSNIIVMYSQNAYANFHYLELYVY